MKHIHHIIPKHMGGTDDPSNLIELSRKEHAMAHMKLYEQYGKKEDLGAYYLLTGQTDKAAKISSSLGGTVQGKINANNGHMRKIQKLANWSEAGKKGGAATISSGKGAFGDPIQRLESCRKGGRIQGKVNAETGHLKRISALSKRSTGKIWLTDGITNMMINPDEIIPEGFQKGKTQKKGGVNVYKHSNVIQNKN
jgi:hypothetical protein